MVDWKEFDVTIEAGGEIYRLLCEGLYWESGGSPSIVVYREEDGVEELWAKLTTNVRSWEPATEDEILVKTWSENEGWIDDILTHGPFEDTGRRVPTGFVQASVWKHSG